jgi:hypothetical protein
MNEKPIKGTVVATVPCFSCGRDGPVKLDKNGRAYWVCVWPLADTGNRCNAHIRYPWTMTDAMISDYMKENSHAAQSTRAERQTHYATKETSAAAAVPAADTAPTGTYLDYV